MASAASFGTLASQASVASQAQLTQEAVAADGTFISAGATSTIDSLINDLDTALTSLRSNAQTLGTNISLLSTRLEFTENYVNTLEEGAGKLTLADLNEEGANLLALQTRQALGTQALAFSSQAEQAILQLFV